MPALPICRRIFAIEREENRREKGRLAVSVHAADQHDWAAVRKCKAVFPRIHAEILNRQPLDYHSSSSMSMCPSARTASKKISLYAAPISFFRAMRAA